MIRLIVALILLATAPAYSQTVSTPANVQDAAAAKAARIPRMIVLETKLVTVQQMQAKATQAHDVWLQGIKNPVDPSIPHNPTDTANANWIEALNNVEAIAKQLYPEQPTALFVKPETNPFKAVPGDDGMQDPAAQFTYRQAANWKGSALPQIQGLINRMTNEIAAIRTDIANNP